MEICVKLISPLSIGKLLGVIYTKSHLPQNKQCKLQKDAYFKAPNYGYCRKALYKINHLSLTKIGLEIYF